MGYVVASEPQAASISPFFRASAMVEPEYFTHSMVEGSPPSRAHSEMHSV